MFRVTLFAFCLSLLLACNNSEPEDTYNTPAQESQHPDILSLDQQIQKEASNPDLYKQRANLYIQMRDYIAAEQDLRQLVGLQADTVGNWLTLADLYYKQGKIKEAVLVLQEGLEFHPKSTQILLVGGRYLFYVQSHQKSLKFLNDALRIDPLLGDAYFWKALNQRDQGDTLKAISSLQTAVEQKPDFYEAYMQLGLLLSNHMDPLAVAYFKNALKIDSNSTEALYGIGMFEQKQRQVSAAIETYKKIILKDAQFERAFYNIGYIYYQMDSIGVAHKYFDLAIKVAPTYAAAYYMRGACSEMQGNWTEAKKDYNHSLNLHPGFEEALQGLKRTNQQL